MKKRQKQSIATFIKNRDRSIFYIVHPLEKMDLPLFLTDFEKKVYRATCKIPKGQTRSYKWVAQKIGSPKAFRAVGNALHKNPYPGIIPCHRVIKSDGTLGGFSRGPQIKKRLLAQERLLSTNIRA